MTQPGRVALKYRPISPTQITLQATALYASLKVALLAKMAHIQTEHIDIMGPRLIGGDCAGHYIMINLGISFASRRIRTNITKMLDELGPAMEIAH